MIYSHITSNKINDVLIKLTDVIGFDHSAEHQDAFNLALDELNAIVLEVSEQCAGRSPKDKE